MRIIHTLVASVASTAVYVVGPCARPEFASLPECVEAGRIAKQLELTKTLYGRLVREFSLNRPAYTALSPVDGMVLDSLIDRAMVDLHEGEKKIVDHLRSSDYSPELVDAIFDRRFAYLESAIRAYIQKAVIRATDHTVTMHESLENELREIKSKDAQMTWRAEEIKFQVQYFDTIASWIKKYENAVAIKPNREFPKFSVYKKILDEKIGAMLDMTNLGDLKTQKDEIIILLSSLEAKGMSFHTLWLLCRESYKKITHFRSAIYNQFNADMAVINARRFEVVTKLNRLAAPALRATNIANHEMLPPV